MTRRFEGDYGYVPPPSESRHRRAQGIYMPALRAQYDGFDPRSMRLRERELGKAQKRLLQIAKEARRAPEHPRLPDHNKVMARNYESWASDLERNRKGLKARIAYFDCFLQTSEGREWLRKEKLHRKVRTRTRGSR